MTYSENEHLLVRPATSNDAQALTARRAFQGVPNYPCNEGEFVVLAHVPGETGIIAELTVAWVSSPEESDRFFTGYQVGVFEEKELAAKDLHMRMGPFAIEAARALLSYLAHLAQERETGLTVLLKSSDVPESELAHLKFEIRPVNILGLNRQPRPTKLYTSAHMPSPRFSKGNRLLHERSSFEWQEPKLPSGVFASIGSMRR